MIESKTLKEIVHDLLFEFPEMRESDRKLISGVYDHLGIDIVNRSFLDVILDDKAQSFESIRRLRQKVQEECPSLKASRKTQDRRTELTGEYTKLAIGEQAMLY